MTRASVYTVSNSITSRCRDCGLLFDGKVDTSHTCPRGGRRAQNNSTNTTKRSNSIKKKTTSAKCSNNTNIIAAYTDKAAAKKRIEDAIARLKNKTPSTTAAKTPGHPNFESLVANLEKPLPNARISSVHAIQKYQLSKNGESSNQPSREESRLKSSSMLKYDDMMKDLSRELQIIEERRLKVVSSSSKVKNPRCGGCLSTILHRGSAFKIDALSKVSKHNCILVVSLLISIFSSGFIRTVSNVMLATRRSPNLCTLFHTRARLIVKRIMRPFFEDLFVQLVTRPSKETLPML